MEDEPDLGQVIRARIARVFAVRRRWLGYYMLAADQLMEGLQPAGQELADIVEAMIAHGQLLGVYDSRKQFWWYLHTSLMPTPVQLAAAVPPRKGGPLLCRNVN